MKTLHFGTAVGTQTHHPNRQAVRRSQGYRVRLYLSCRTASGGTPRCECLQPTQQTQAVTFLIANSNGTGNGTLSPARE